MTTKPKGTKSEKPETLPMESALEIGKNCACYNLRKAARSITRFYDAVLKPSGLKVTQLTMLTAVRINEEITIKRLAKIMSMDRTTLSRNVAILVKKGLIDMKPGDDIRSRKLSLTEKGHTALKEDFPLWKKAQAEIVGQLGEKRWVDLLAGISDLVSAPDLIT